MCYCRWDRRKAPSDVWDARSPNSEARRSFSGRRRAVRPIKPPRCVNKAYAAVTAFWHRPRGEKNAFHRVWRSAPKRKPPAKALCQPPTAGQASERRPTTTNSKKKHVNHVPAPNRRPGLGPTPDDDDGRENGSMDRRGAHALPPRLGALRQEVDEGRGRRRFENDGPSPIPRPEILPEARKR